jgi:hypothetical protein
MVRTHPLTKELDAYTKARAADPALNAEFWAIFAELLPAKLAELAGEHKNAGPKGEKRFGMSGAGSCVRKATLKYIGYEPEPIDADTRMTWDFGHLVEVMAVASLRGLGYELLGAQTPVYLDPFMHSASDEVIIGAPAGAAIQTFPTIVSVKSTAYKMSGKRGSTFTRRGFTELPFEGVRKCQPSWWAQAQAEMEASGTREVIVLAVAKDVVKVFANDPYMKESGSLVFYTELIEHDEHFCQTELIPVWGNAWDAATDGHASHAWYLRGDTSRYVKLPKPGDDGAGWGGVNQTATGTFNPCGGCDLVEACKRELARSYRRTA